MALPSRDALNRLFEQVLRLLAAGIWHENGEGLAVEARQDILFAQSALDGGFRQAHDLLKGSRLIRI